MSRLHLIRHTDVHDMTLMRKAPTTKNLATKLFTGLLMAATAAAASATSLIVNNNPIGNPDFATSFDSLPASVSLSASQSFDGFVIRQVNGDPNGISSTFNPGGTGSGRGWYPNGGDRGYTEITLQNAATISDAAIFVGSGLPNPAAIGYELLFGGVVIEAGTLSGTTREFQWLSITNVLFDTIRLRDSVSASFAFRDGGLNGLALDFISVSAIPLPAAAWLFLTALGGMFVARHFPRIRE